MDVKGLHNELKMKNINASGVKAYLQAPLIIDVVESTLSFEMTNDTRNKITQVVSKSKLQLSSSLTAIGLGTEGDKKQLQARLLSTVLDTAFHDQFTSYDAISQSKNVTPNDKDGSSGRTSSSKNCTSHIPNSSDKSILSQSGDSGKEDSTSKSSKGGNDSESNIESNSNSDSGSNSGTDSNNNSNNDSDSDSSSGSGSGSNSDNSDVFFLKDADPARHILASTLDHRDPNTNEQSSFSKIGWRERLLKRQDAILSRKNELARDKDGSSARELEDLGLLCCTEKDKFGNRCLRKFSSKASLRRHVEKGAATRSPQDNKVHLFPAHNTMDTLIHDVQSGKFALCLACGTMTNRDSAIAGKVDIETYELDVRVEDVKKKISLPSFFDAFSKPGSFRRDNKYWKKKNFKASQALNNDLELLFLEGDGNEGKKKMQANTPQSKQLPF